MADPGKILVIRGGAIGGFILTFPVFSALREHFSTAHLEVLAYPQFTPLALAGGLVDGARSIEARGLAGFFARDGDLAENLVGYFSGFAVIISFLYDPDDILKTNVGRCSKAQFIQGPHRPDENGQLHATEVLLQPLERLAIFAPDPVPRLRLATSHLPGVSQTEVDRRIALHPGSGSERKNWPEPKWAELLHSLVQFTNHQFILVGGEAEGSRLGRLTGMLPANRVEALQSRALVEVAERLTTCTCFIGHDSGISHLSAAIGLRSLVLWGETADVVWRPRGDHVTILRDPAGLPSLSIPRVLEELNRLQVTG